MLALGACGGASGSGDSDQAVLRVGDQFKRLEATLASAGEDKPSDYHIEWSSFVGGPAVIAAQTGGSVDVGWMMETPLVFSQAAGSLVKVVAAARRSTPGTSPNALVVATGSRVRTVADLRGHSVGFLPGTVTQYLVVQLLDKAGLSLADIRPVTITNVGPSLLENGTVDAVVTADPYLSQMLEDGTARVIATGGEPLTPEFNYLVAPDAALADPRRAALIGDFVARVARATRWQREHVAQAVPVIARAYNIPPPIAERMLRRAPGRYVPIDASIVAGHQAEADTFHRLGLIRNRLDASQLFDRRYDAIVAKAEATP
jgi:sulfonate transport system substrate-binding protein